MDFEFTEEQKMFRATVRDFLKTECTLRLIRRVEEEGLKEFLPVYRKMGQQGFWGISLPEESGGSGGSWLDFVILNEEAGAVLMPNIPLGSIALAGQAIATLGDSRQKQLLIPQLIRGEMVVSPAWLEDESDSRQGNTRTRVLGDPEHMMVEGRKCMVSHFDVATHFLICAETLRQTERSNRLWLVLLESGRDEITCHPLRLQSGEWVANMDIGRAVIEKDDCLACRRTDWLKLIDRAKIALAAYSIGAARAALDLGVSYAKQRIQFGKPIGTFQAVQHKLAEAACSIELAKMAVYYAAWLCDRQENCTGEAAAARLLAGQAIGQTAKASALCHGAYGFSMDSDIQFYFRRIKVLQHQLESLETQKEIIAASYGF